jgi:thymidylate synthase
MYCLQGENPTKMYLQSIKDLMTNGDEVSPRGKLVKELRPACIEFLNPYSRVTFLGGRRINPFFQVAESLWILSGKADVEWLTKFNANMSMFSDDGKWFNAPYGERIRTWNKNALHNVVINPIDQLADVYRKLVNDKDTRQAVIVISNPMFDNSKYTIDEKGKDIACNLVITFKIRHDALNMTVFNRSNDTHWGVFGANLCQFSTIQETLLNWLRKSGNPELSSLKMGTYNQITDSLHIYMDSYGSKCTDDVMDYYKENPEEELEVDFLLDSDKGNFEPRMRLSAEEFDAFISVFWSVINPYLMDDETLVDDERCEEVFGKVGLVDGMYRRGVIDDYWLMVIQAMLSYRLVKMGVLSKALNYMSVMADCQWKVSMMFFLKTFIYKQEGDMKEEYYNKFNEIVGNMKLSYSNAFGEDSKEVNMLMKYLAL